MRRAALSEGPWAEMGVATDQDEDDVIPDSHAHAILTNELPLATSRDLELPEVTQRAFFLLFFRVFFLPFPPFFVVCEDRDR